MLNVSSELENRLIELSQMSLLPREHAEYLFRIRDEFNFNPKVIYDIGASVLHWTNVAKYVWPDAKFIAFEAQPSTEFLFRHSGLDYNIGLLSDQDGKTLEFFCNDYHPAGSSYYPENVQLSPAARELYSARQMTTVTLDTVVANKNFPAPDLIKMDVQGAEMDVLRGAANTLKSCKHLILELQTVEYNVGAPLKDEVIAYLQGIGFRLVTALFCNNGCDGDYHFIKD